MVRKLLLLRGLVNCFLELRDLLIDRVNFVLQQPCVRLDVHAGLVLQLRLGAGLGQFCRRVVPRDNVCAP